MQLSQLWVYPVKSLPGVQLQQARVDARGLLWDRHWMLVDEQGNFLSQRQLPQMALIKLNLLAEGISLEADRRESLSLGFNEHSGNSVSVTVWDDSLKAFHVSSHADQWFSDFLGVDAKLVVMQNDVIRKVDPAYASDMDQTGFSDGFPFLLLGQASIDDLNGKINQVNIHYGVRRFRPNLVITEAQAYAEDQWQRIQIGDITFRVVKPCSRCAITTVDPLTAERGAEPLKTLNTYRRKGNKVYFGQNLIHDSTGLLSVGDDVRILAA